MRTVLTISTNKESNSTAKFECRKFLYNFNGLDVISLLVKYYISIERAREKRNLIRFCNRMRSLDSVSQ